MIDWVKIEVYYYNFDVERELYEDGGEEIFIGELIGGWCVGEILLKMMKFGVNL